MSEHEKECDDVRAELDELHDVLRQQLLKIKRLEAEQQTADLLQQSIQLAKEHTKFIDSTQMRQPLDFPDSPGWWAFEGSEWTSLSIYKVDEVEYRGWQEEWDEEAEEYWHRHELNLYEPIRYEDVPGEPFRTVVEVKWAYKGQAVCQRKRSGPYEGEKTLGFLSPKYRWNHALYTPDNWVGKWTKINLPWDQTKESRMPERMMVDELERKFDAVVHEMKEVEQILGEALGYPRYVDDPENFPDATERDGVCVGDMTPATLAAQIAFRLKKASETKEPETEKPNVTVNISPMLKLTEDTIYFEPVAGQLGAWHPALVEVTFEDDVDGRVIFTTPTDTATVLVNLTVAEWRAITLFINQRIEMQKE